MLAKVFRDLSLQINAPEKTLQNGSAAGLNVMILKIFSQKKKSEPEKQIRKFDSNCSYLGRKNDHSNSFVTTNGNFFAGNRR
jgi:hypothetical protein